MDAEYGFFLRLGLLLMAEEIAHCEADSDRLQRMRAALVNLWAQLARDYPEATKAATLPADAARLLPGFETRELAVRYLIDLVFSNPFTPYEHKVFPNPRWTGIERVARELPALQSALTTDLQALRKICEEVQSGHKPIHWERLALSVAGIAVATAVLAPAAAVWLGATGLAGAAAITHGLALLGGGAVAAGGLGMAGGLWVLAGASTLAGGSTILTAAQMLKAMGFARASVEIMKLQVSFKIIRLETKPPDYPAAFQDIQTLAQRIQEFRFLLDEERGLNVKGAERVKDMEETLEAMERALKWMKQEAIQK